MSLGSTKNIGIRLENKSHESRTPLIPYDVKDLLLEYKGKLQIFVERSRTRELVDDEIHLKPRCFSDSEFETAGATIVDNFNQCLVIFGIKEIPDDYFEQGKTYAFFSHTYKGQPYNREMFLSMMRKQCTLVDYELIVENEAEAKLEEARKSLHYSLAPCSKFKRTVYFGKHAGIVGAINTLWVLGLRLAECGFKTPFLNLKQAYQYRRDPPLIENSFESYKDGINDYSLAKQDLKTICAQLKEGLPENCPPIIIGITGKSGRQAGTDELLLGNAATGAKEVIDILNPIRLSPEELLTTPHFVSNRIYVVYFDRNQTSESEFQKYLPQLTVLLNCMKWEKGHEKPVSVKNLRDLFQKTLEKVLVIGDITCDPGGSVEPCQDVYSDKPYYMYEPAKDISSSGDWENDTQRAQIFQTSCTQNSVVGNGPVIMSVTNLPCEFPKESSRKFSFMLREYIMDIANIDGNAVSFASLDVRRAIKRAIILYKGILTPDYQYLKDRFTIDTVAI